MRLRLLGVTLCLLGVVVSSAPLAVGQAALSFAQLNGTVLDAGGRAVVNAQVAVRDLDTNQSFQSTTNTAGFFVVPNPRLGNTN